MQIPPDWSTPCACLEKRRFSALPITEIDPLIDLSAEADQLELIHELRHRKTRMAARARDRLVRRMTQGDLPPHQDEPVDDVVVRDPVQTRTLSAEQQAVVRAAVGARLLVTAGPGTGKTHVLINRIASLVQAADLAPGSEILLLTFSRAAVGEIRRRVREVGGRVAWVRAYTFDSFVTGLLSELDPEGAWVREGYDGRIRAAVRLILRNGAAERLREYRHVFVDELQDVVGPRADLVLAILRRSDCGWTLFGDPAQGIYNFQLEGDARREGAAFLYKDLRKEFASSLREHRFTENFRASSDAAQVGLWAGSELNDVVPDYASIHARLQTTMMRLPAAPAPGAFSALSGQIGILCPWNGQALLVSRGLWERGIDHRMRRSSTDRIVPAWVGRLLGGVRATSLGRRAFETLWADLELTDAPPVDQAWSELHALDPGPLAAAVDIERVVRRIQARFLPDEFEDRTAPRVTVSTIHRSKGLEYDHVFVVPIPERTLEPDELAEEARLLYVALSRARRHLNIWPAPDTSGMRSVSVDWRGDERWIRNGYRRWHLRGLEVQPDDTDREVPFPGSNSAISAVGVQAYLADSVRPGDAVELELVDSSGLYTVVHGESQIAAMGDSFHTALKGQLYGPRKNWPERISGLFVESVDSVAGDVGAARQAGLPGPGVWLRARVHGLGDLHFPPKDGDA